LLDIFSSHRRLDVAPDSGERYRLELVIAAARLFLAAAALLAIYLDPSEPSPYVAPALGYALLISYVVFSGVVLVYVRSRGSVSERVVFVVQGIDILWPAVMSLFTEGPNSPFFVLVSFGLLAAAFRWGMRAALMTALMGVGSILMQALVLMPRIQLVQGQFDVNRLIVRSAFLLVMGLLIGFVTEGHKQLRAEQSLAAALVQQILESERSLSSGVHQVLEGFATLFDSTRVVVPARDEHGGQFYLWTLDRRNAASSELRLREMESGAGEECLAPLVGTAWFAQRTAEGGFWRVQAINAQGHSIAGTQFYFPATLVGEAQTLLAVEFGFAKAWTGRLVILDAQLQGPAARELRFAQRLLVEVAPALYNLYLVRRLRSRVGAVERARAGREIHDGALQSLISVEMRLDIARRRSEADAAPVAIELGEIQKLLRREILAVRELMLQMKPIDVGPRDLVDFIANTVDRFRHDSGMEAKFAAAVEEVPLPGRTCRELARVVQEALVNIRKHSQATRVLVRFGPAEDGWKLVVEDNGRGFAPAGDGAIAPRPAVIAERVALIGGRLAIESVPGEGARLEITVPRASRATHAG
jgi:signal transduction histidine kinase